MIRYAKQKTFVGIEYFDLTDPLAKRRLLEMRVNAILRGQPRGKKIGETKTKPPRTPRSAF
jgi:hypothetical protein